jgi:hypothetical protein
VTEAERLDAAQAILAREGIPALVTIAGHARDVAAVSAAPEHLARLAELAPEVKALGFRYLALELQAGE